jgi:hypothetical protein
MKKLLLIISLLCLLVGCKKNKNDFVDIQNESMWVFDNWGIKVKDGYFIDDYEKFTVDENTIGITLYFKNNDTWSEEE